MRLGIADHLGWAIAVTASDDHEVVDRRRIELIEPGMSAAPIHYESRRLDVAATAALVATARASVVRATSAALDELAAALPAPIRSISLRAWPPDFPDDIAVQRRAPYEARADAIMYRQELAELAHARGWEVHALRREGSGRSGGQDAGRAGPTRSCRDLGQRSGRPGRRTIGSRSPRRSWPAERLDGDAPATRLHRPWLTTNVRLCAPVAPTAAFLPFTTPVRSIGASAASQLGDWLFNAALLGYVYSATGSAAWVGAATICRLLPYVLLGPRRRHGRRPLRPADGAPGRRSPAAARSCSPSPRWSRPTARSSS